MTGVTYTISVIPWKVGPSPHSESCTKVQQAHIFHLCHTLAKVQMMNLLCCLPKHSSVNPIRWDSLNHVTKLTRPHPNSLSSSDNTQIQKKT